MYSLLPATIPVNFRIGTAPADRLLLHTNGRQEKATLETSTGRYNLTHYFNKYRKRHQITVAPYDILQYCSVAEGERENRTLSDILANFRSDQLPWIGRTDPALLAMSAILQAFNNSITREAQAEQIQNLMTYALNHGLPFCNRHEKLRSVIIERAKALSTFHEEFPACAHACNAVLKALGEDEHVVRENWKTLNCVGANIYLRIEGYPTWKGILEANGLIWTASQDKEATPTDLLYRYIQHYSITVRCTWELSDVFKNYYLTVDGSTSLYEMLCDWNAENRYLLTYDDCDEYDSNPYGYDETERNYQQLDELELRLRALKAEMAALQVG
jgi:hypothetical protein